MMPKNCKKIFQRIAISFWEVGEFEKSVFSPGGGFFVYKHRNSKGCVFKDVGSSSYYILKTFYVLSF